MKDILLRVRGATKLFGAVQALVNADLDVHRGEVVALVGDNAAGKSTLARAISGIYRLDAGTMEFDGAPVDFHSASDALHAGIATVFQELALSDNLDVASNIFLGREVVKGALMDERTMHHLAREYLDRLNSRITSTATRLSELSAGQRQCVAIARTLVGNPQLIVLDEPTASLSIMQTAEVLSHIQSLRDTGMGVILISHSLTDVRAVADRIEVLRHGRNNGSFNAAHDRYEDVIAAITGATRIGS